MTTKLRATALRKALTGTLEDQKEIVQNFVKKTPDFDLYNKLYFRAEEVLAATVIIALAESGLGIIDKRMEAFKAWTNNEVAAPGEIVLMDDLYDYAHDHLFRCSGHIGLSRSTSRMSEVEDMARIRYFSKLAEALHKGFLFSDGRLL